eukprot:scaffold2193_cov179-Ochromonas_danica.AAC.19
MPLNEMPETENRKSEIGNRKSETGKWLTWDLSLCVALCCCVMRKQVVDIPSPLPLPLIALPCLAVIVA